MFTKQKLAFFNAELDKINDQINNFELDPWDYTDEYDDFLDEFGPVEIGNLSYNASHVLKEVDPVAYDCGLSDYVDTIDLDNVPEYRDLLAQQEELTDEITNLEEQLEQEEEDEDEDEEDDEEGPS